jgi:TonB-linked SusC/RagA family outer membrane protein
MKQTIFLFLAYLALSAGAFAQTKTIRGAVKDRSTNEPLMGVLVGVKNTGVGNVTGSDGTYVLAGVPDSAKTLVFHMLGYKTQELPLGDNLIVVMQTLTLQLDETVITANAIKREKRSLGYATQQVKGDDLTAGATDNLLGALEGKVSGVNVTSVSGSAGSSNRIVLRGGTSLTGNNQALMVVDGVPIDNSNFRSNGNDDLNNQVDYGNRGNDINPEDVESISVLKGPAAAALYGSRASNGAIIITTKHGRKSETKNMKTAIEYSNSFALSNILKLPTFQNQYGEGDVYPGRDPVDRRENFSWGLPFDGKLRPWGQDINGMQRVKPYQAIPNNVRDFFDLGQTETNNLAFTGGNDRSTFYLSLNALNSTGVIPSSDYNKYGVRVNATSDLGNYFSTSVSANYTNINSTLANGGQTGSVMDNLIQTPRDIPIIAGKDLTNPFNKYDDVTHTYGFYGAYTTNPYFVLNNYKNFNNVDRLQGNFSVAFDRYSWLSIIERVGGDVYSDRRTQEWKKYNYDPIDPYYAGNTKVYQGKYSQDNYNLDEITHDLMVILKKDLTPKWKGSLLFGHNVRQSKLLNTYDATNAQGGLALADYYNLSNSNGMPISTNSFSERRLVGLYADANVSYKNMVFIGATARNDWSSTLPQKNNSFFYPSANVSWVFSELFKEQLKESKWTYGKVRASIASVGNDASPYLTSSIFNVANISGSFGNTQFPFGNIVGYSQGSSVGNPDIKPEITTAIEAGAEMGFFKDRLSFDLSVYQNTSKDQIINVPISNTTGFSSKTLNAGEIDNKGIEILIRATPVVRKKLKWELYATYTHNQNTVVSIQPGVDQIVLGGFSGMSVVAAVGRPYGTFYGVDLLKDQNGHVVIDPATGLPQTTPNSVYLGSYQPKYMGSLGTKLTYGNFTLNILFDTKVGGYFYSQTKSLMDFTGTAGETVDRTDKVWPNSVYKDVSGNYVTNTNIKYNVEDYYTNKIPPGQMLVDATYVKWRELGLNYTLPSKYLTKTPLGMVSIGIFGNNLFVWTPSSNQFADPEMNSSGASNTQGFQFSAQPSQRNYGAKIRVTF